MEAVASQVVVLFFLMIGSGVGEELASFMFGRIKGRLNQIIYILLFMPLFVLGGYAYILFGISNALLSTALFFGLWGVMTVFVSRGTLYLGGKMWGVKLKSRKRGIRGKLLTRYLRKYEVEDHEVKEILMRVCESGRKGEKLFEGGAEWVRVDPHALCYELSNRGFEVNHILEALTRVLRLNTEEAAMIWRKSSV